MNEIEAYPLTWPPRFSRTPSDKRKRANFSKANRGSDSGYRYQRQITIAEGRDDLLDQLRQLGAKDVILSTNLRVRIDGLPYSNQKEPEDSGIAVYFTWEGEQRALACDKWTRVADNLRAVAKSVEAMRGLDRWGVSDILHAAFTGFTALPQNASASIAAWWDILGLENRCTRADVERAWREKAIKAHPDRGGDRRTWDVLQAAYEQGLAATRNETTGGR